jgi:hypothetical protein
MTKAPGKMTVDINGKYTDGGGMKTQPTLYPKTRWTSERIARLGFLIGQGWDAKKVASDPVIASSANNVHRQAQRFGLAFRERTGGPFHLPGEAAALYDTAAARRGLTREGLIKVLLVTAAADDGLIDNILDDGL